MARTMDERTLAVLLADIGERLDHPAPTRMAVAVRARIVERRRRDGTRSARRAFGPVVLTAALLALVVTLASPQARAAALEFLHLRGVQIFRVPALPSPTSSPEGSGSRGERFGGQAVSLAEARSRVGFAVVVPAELGAPDEVYVDAVPGGDRVTLVYLTGRGLPPSSVSGVSAVVVELRGSVERAFIGKLVGGGTTVETVSVDGAPGLWVAGAPHFLFYRDPSGEVRQETTRLSGNTLLWQRGDVTIRLEAQVTRDQALRIASSAR